MPLMKRIQAKLSTCLAMMIVASVLVCANVSLRPNSLLGDLSISHNGIDIFDLRDAMYSGEHGWPWRFLVHECSVAPFPGMVIGNRLIQSQVAVGPINSQMKWDSLFGDMFIALAILLMVYLACEYALPRLLAMFCNSKSAIPNPQS
jgi:hypothetical protein